MAELTEQQVHLQQVLEQQQQLSQEAQQLNIAVQNNNAMFTKLQGVREYLEQTGVTLPQPEAPVEASAPTEAPETEAEDS